MTTTRILAAACVRQEPQVFAAYITSLRELTLPPNHQLDLVFIADPDGEKLEAFEDLYMLKAPDKPEGSTYKVGETSHEWSEPTFHWLALAKQDLINYALREGYDYIFFVDTDLLLSRDTLVSALSAKAQIVSSVFWTGWVDGNPPLPQVWLRHPYDLSGRLTSAEEFVSDLEYRQLVEVNGGGACILIHRSALEKGLTYHPILPELPQGGMWRGEDRSFCVRAQRLHIRHLADAWPDIIHLYHPFQRTPEYIQEAQEFLEAANPSEETPKFGDLISFSVEPLECPEIKKRLPVHPTAHVVRGRFGALDLAPEIEMNLSSMKAGEHRIFNIFYPHNHPIGEYRGKKKAVKLTLIGTKPFELPPVRGDYLTREIEG